MLPARFHRDPFPIAVLTVNHEDPVAFRVLDELRSVRSGQKPETSRGLTPRVRIVQTIPEDTVLMEGFGPGSEGNLRNQQIGRQRVARFPDELSVEQFQNPFLSGTRRG
jgi:hypothetical protein